VLNKILPASLLLTPFSAYNADQNTAAHFFQTRPSIISRETVQRIRATLAAELRPKKITLSFTNKEREALIAPAIEEKFELMKLPVNLKVYPQDTVYARFARNQNVFLISDKDTPFTIPAGSFVLINEQSIKLPRETSVLGDRIIMNGKVVRFDEAPGIAPAGSVYLMEHAKRKSSAQDTNNIQISIAA
jgi:hypothetical protein